MILHRLARFATLGAATGAVVVILTTPGGIPVHATAMGVILVTTAGFGALIALIHRPAPFDAALLIDRRFGLDELLSTAWILGRAEAPMPRAMLAFANSKVAELHPRQVAINPWPASVWSGLALLPLGAAMWVLFNQTSVSPTEANTAQTQSGQTVAFTSSAVNPSPSGVVSDPRSDRSAGGTDDPRSETALMGAGVGDGVANARPAAGEGQSATADHRTDPADRADRADGADAASAPDGVVAGGTGRSEGAASPGGASAGPPPGLQADATAAAEVPPWRTSDWPARQARARRCLDGDAVPVDHRPMVRDYFGFDQGR